MDNIDSTRATYGFRTWHRKLGLAAIPLVLILLFTGILLNHSEELGLDSVPLSYGMLELVYGVRPDAETLGYSLGGHWLTGQGNRLILDSTPFAERSEPLNGAVFKGDLFIALCSDSLFLVTPEGQLVERLGESHGLPASLVRIGSDSDHLFLETDGGVWKFDPVSLVTTKVSGDSVTWSSPERYPEGLLADITADLIVDDINLERLILDIHSGRVLGIGGVLLVDFVALLMTVLALSGFLMWVKKR